MFLHVSLTHLIPFYIFSRFGIIYFMIALNGKKAQQSGKFSSFHEVRDSRSSTTAFDGLKKAIR